MQVVESSTLWPGARFETSLKALRRYSKISFPVVHTGVLSVTVVNEPTLTLTPPPPKSNIFSFQESNSSLSLLVTVQSLIQYMRVLLPNGGRHMRSHVVTVHSRDRQQWMTIRKANPMMAILACEKQHEDYRDCDREKMYWLADSDEHVGKYQSRTTIITSFCRPIPQGTTPTSYKQMERANYRVYILEAGTQIPSLEQIYAALRRLRFGTLVHPRVAREELERREACRDREPVPPHGPR